MSARDVMSLTGDAAPPAAAGTMELVSGMLRLGGDVGNEVPKVDVTPAEAVFLRAIHGGPETFYNLRVTGSKEYNAGKERTRLLQKYRRDDHARLLGSLFPGVRPNFPTTLAEVEEIANEERRVAEEEMTPQEGATNA